MNRLVESGGLCGIMMKWKQVKHNVLFITCLLILLEMVLTPSTSGPIDCTAWDALVDEDGFLGLGRNRYCLAYAIYTDGT